jgi:type VI secretion system Hcp family effector
MKSTRALLTTFFAAALLAAGPASAAVNAYLKIDGIPGESMDGQHQGWIEITSFSFDIPSHQTIGSATGGAGAGKIKFNEFTIKKTTDSASPAFFKNCVAGAHYKTVVLRVRKAGGDPRSAGQPFLTYTFHDCLITAFTGGAPRGGGIAANGLTLQYSRVDVAGLDPTPTPTRVTVKPAVVAPKPVAH